MGFKSSSVARYSVLPGSTQAKIKRFREKMRLEGFQGVHGPSSCSGKGRFKARSYCMLLLKVSQDGDARVSLDRTAFPCSEPELTLLQITTICHNAMSCHCMPQNVALCFSKTFFRWRETAIRSLLSISSLS